MKYFFDENISNNDIIEINIKILNNTYQIYLDKIIYQSDFVITYEGIDMINKQKIIIDKYNDLLLFTRKITTNIITISHNNIIKFIDVILEKNITYIIKPHYDNLFFSKMTSINSNKLFKYFKQINDSIIYLFNKNIMIKTLLLNNIFIYNDNVIISPYFSEIHTQNKCTKSNNILYGSPLYLTNELLNNIPEKESKILWKIGIIFFQMLSNEIIKDDYTEYNKILSDKIINKYNNLNINIEYLDLLEIIIMMIDMDKKISLNTISIFLENNIVR